MAGQPNSIQQQGLQNGVIAGILYVMFIVVLYMMGGDMLFNTWAQLIGYLIPTIMMIITVQMYRKQHGLFVTFQQAFGGAFAVSVVAFLILTLFDAVLYGLIDPDLVVRKKDFAIEQAYQWLQSSHLSETEIEAQMQLIRERNYGPSFANSGMAYGLSVIFSALFAAIIALIFWLISRKYEPAPQFNTQSSEILDN